jgi:hypothetical protein
MRIGRSCSRTWRLLTKHKVRPQQQFAPIASGREGRTGLEPVQNENGLKTHPAKADDIDMLISTDVLSKGQRNIKEHKRVGSHC